MRVMVKRLLKKYKYPPEGQEQALNTVMAQCNQWADNESNFTVNINIANNNVFEKPVGAVVIPGVGDNIMDIKDVIEIKKEQ